MDAKIWTDEFLSLNPDAKDFGTMIGWFANAIMVGYDHATWKLQPALDQAQAEIARLRIALRNAQHTIERNECHGDNHSYGCLAVTAALKGE